MTVRVVLTVVLLLAVAGVALPVVDRTARDAAGRRVQDEATRIRDTVAALTGGNDPTGRGAPSATRSIEVSLPTRRFGTAAVRTFTLGGDGSATAADGPQSDVVVARIAGGQRRTFRLPVDVRIRRDDELAPDRVGLRLRDGDRVSFRLVWHRGRAVVVATRGFTTESAANERHGTAGPVHRRPGLHL